jgi:hypothetical protein
MLVHANAKLGLGGRLALVRAVEAGVSLKAAAAVACHRASVVASVGGRWSCAAGAG